ncbi:MAG: hypothetical protein U5O39_04650 [Gammaproteobacteria bacterium]|nr:hypothetical protein [Gammaproteobacteria bacterium]
MAFERQGANEPAIGGDRARHLRSRFLARILGDETEVMAIRDRIAAWLEERAA